MRGGEKLMGEKISGALLEDEVAVKKEDLKKLIESIEASDEEFSRLKDLISNLLRITKMLTDGASGYSLVRDPISWTLKEKITDLKKLI